MIDTLPNKDAYCHRTGFTKKCRALVCGGKCQRWMVLEGEDTQTGNPMVNGMCKDDWVPVILMDLVRKTKNGLDATQKEVNVMRNMVWEMNGSPDVAAGRSNQTLPELNGSKQLEDKS